MRIFGKPVIVLIALKESGFVPLYEKGFQRFRVTDKIIAGPANSLILNAASLKLDTDFAPFAFSQNSSFSGEVVFASNNGCWCSHQIK